MFCVTNLILNSKNYIDVDSKADSIPGASVPVTFMQRSGNPNPSFNVQVSEASAGVDAVMLSFQQAMLQMTTSFLQAEQQVMLAYLQAKSGGLHSTAVQQSSTPYYIPALPPSYHQRPAANVIIKQALEPDVSLERPVGASVVAALEEQNLSVQFAPLSSKESEQSEQTQSRSADELISCFIELVSERTGYPAEMLDPTLDLESDLGIDSIKRVEILSNFRRLLPEQVQEKLESDLEELGGLRTIDAISDWIRKIQIPAGG